jgi:uncharacterized protein YjeT (DUF2065 family)
MKIFLYVISFIWIAGGCCMILYTSETRSVMDKMIQEIDRRILFIVPFIAGILFLFAASASHNPWFIRFIGLMGVAKGVFVLVAPDNLYDQINNWYLKSLSDQALRLWGIIALILGTAVLSWIL